MYGRKPKPVKESLYKKQIKSIESIPNVKIKMKGKKENEDRQES